MGLDMYLFAEEYKTNLRGSCEYPMELNAFVRSIKGRSPQSINAKYKIGYWHKEWEIHAAIMANAECKTENTADLGVNDMTAIVDALEGMRLDAKNEKEIRELDYSISLFQDAIRLANTNKYDITYYASW